MNKYPQIEITVYANRHSYKSERQKDARWLHMIMPLIMETQVMITDELYIAPLRQAVSLCLS
jgi:hypothetical protein